MDNTKWPAALNWVIPGTPEFTARYTAGDTAGGEPVIAGTGCTAAHGGDAYRYTLDFFTQLGAILDAQATATGHGGDDAGRPGAADGAVAGAGHRPGHRGADPGVGEKVMATPGALIPMPAAGAALAGGAGVCADTLKAYGTPAADAPFGFGFYTAPDQGSVDFLMTELAGQQDLPPAVKGESVWANPAQFYDPVNGAENPLRTWEFSPLTVTGYCTDENNPFCLTAAFLRCPAGDGATDAETAAITACRTWNANVIILNQDIAMTLLEPGVGVPAGGELRPLDAAASPGQQAPLDGWTAVAVGGKTLTAAVRMLYVTLGGTALVGGLVAGGIPGLLIAAGVIGVAGLVLSQGIFGAVSCAQDFPKCAAAAGADGLVKTLGLIPDAARSAQVPDMTGQSMTTLLSTLGGISAALVLVFFLISLLAAVLMRRPSQIWPAFFGVIGWGAAMGLGGAFLTMLIAARTGVMTWLNTDGGGGTVLDGFPAVGQGESHRDRRGPHPRAAAGGGAVRRRDDPGRHRLGHRVGVRAVDPAGGGPAGAAIGRPRRAGDAPQMVVPRVLRAVDAAAHPGHGDDHLAGREDRPGIEHRLPGPARRRPYPVGLRVLVPDRAADAADGRGQPGWASAPP